MTPSTAPRPPVPAPTQRSRHLMDPDNLQAHRTSQRSLTRVQRWVMSTLATTTVLHMSFGLVVAAFVVEESRLDAQIGLLVIAAAFGMVAVAVGLMIHKHTLVTPWLLLGWVPSLAGAWFLFAV